MNTNHETNVVVSLKAGGTSMENTAPTPSPLTKDPVVTNIKSQTSIETILSSGVTITLAGAGGAGLNLSRAFMKDQRVEEVKFFDTSMTNSRSGETVNIVTNGSGSGSNRSENSSEIQREIAKMSDEHLGLNDVAIVVFGLAGGSGSVLGPLLIREYARKGVRPIAVIIADTTSAVGAKNTLNTLKTLNSIATNNELYIPTLLFTNDYTAKRGDVDVMVMNCISALVTMLTSATYEVDRNDRLNWIDPTKVAGATPGVKLISLTTEGLLMDTNIILGTESEDMVDSLLVLLKDADEELLAALPLSRLKKTGFYCSKTPQIIGRVSSDISAIDKIIDQVEKMQNAEKGQTFKNVSRLQSGSADDLIL